MKKSYPYLFLSSIIVIVGCSTGKKSFNKGDYESAIEKATKRLKSNPYNEKAKTALIDGYWLYFNQLDQGIADLKRTDKKFKWEDIAYKYEQLNRAYALIQSCPACKEVVGYAENYPKETEEARQKAATERYLAGEASLKENTRLSAKQAYFHFQKAKQYNPNYEGVNKSISIAKELATIRVLVSNASESIEKDEYFFKRVYEGILNTNRNQFVSFYEGDIVDPHHTLEISLDYFTMNKLEKLERNEEIQSDSLVVGRVLVDSVYKDVKGVVYADLTTYEKKTSAEGRGTIKIKDLSTGETLSLKSYPEIRNWNAIWATFNGDKRALTEEQYELTEVNEPSTPSSQYFYDKVSDGIGQQLAKHIQQFYKDF